MNPWGLIKLHIISSPSYFLFKCWVTRNFCIVCINIYSACTTLKWHINVVNRSPPPKFLLCYSSLALHYSIVKRIDFAMLQCTAHIFERGLMCFVSTTVTASPCLIFVVYGGVLMSQLQESACTDFHAIPVSTRSGRSSPLNLDHRPRIGNRRRAPEFVLVTLRKTVLAVASPLASLLALESKDGGCSTPDPSLQSFPALR
jgi:hypothetical protein